MDNEFCESCPKRENCFVQEKQQFYSYGFYSYAAGEFTLLFLLFMLVFAVGFLLWVFWLGNELRGETGHSSNPSFWG